MLNIGKEVSCMSKFKGRSKRRLAKTVLIGAGITVLAVSVFAQKGASGTFTDKRDGKTYRTVKIGEQTWMAQNLNYDNGGRGCYGDKESNCAKYGGLYTFEQAQEICPVGWKLPTGDEWNALVTAVGGEKTAGTKLKSKSPGWNGTDAFGFSALPSGNYISTIHYSNFEGLSSTADWWASTFGRDIYGSFGVGARPGSGGQIFHIGYSSKLAVRCLQDTTPLPSPTPGSFIDKRDGKTYRTVKFRNQRWMAQNLDYKTETDSWCYNDSASNCEKYGRLYTYSTAISACPAGWYLPSVSDWDTLIISIHRDLTREGTKTVATKLKSQSPDWNGTDEFGFLALPSGFYNRVDGKYEYLGSIGSWWTATTDRNNNAYSKYMSTEKTRIDMSTDHQQNGNAVRCVQFSPVLPPSSGIGEPLTDSRDGKTYRTVKIGGKTWMAQNLNYQTEASSLCYGDIASNCEKYGRLYTWEAAKSACPAGWHLATREELNQLVTYAGGGQIVGRVLKSESPDWIGTDDMGFSALLGGYRWDGKFEDLGSGGIWWSSTGRDATNAYFLNLTTIDRLQGNGYGNKSHSFSVRCVQD
jgi:uncharacterized protein (TIGR02145 family)